MKNLVFLLVLTLGEHSFAGYSCSGTCDYSQNGRRTVQVNSREWTFQGHAVDEIAEKCKYICSSNRNRSTCSLTHYACGSSRSLNEVDLQDYSIENSL